MSVASALHMVYAADKNQTGADSNSILVLLNQAGKRVFV
jgi:hypothetical protein